MLDVVLYQPEIPGNTGAVGRTCVALDMELILIHPLGFEIDRVDRQPFIACGHRPIIRSAAAGRRRSADR